MMRWLQKRRPGIARCLLFVWVFVSLFAILANARSFAQETPNDPSGGATGKAVNAMTSGGAAYTADDADALAKSPNAPATKADIAKLADVAGQNTLAINYAWLLVTGFLVMFMQAGFAMVETGFTRAKNSAHVMMTNFMIYPIGMLGYWICGFALMYGSVAASKIGGPIALGGLAPLSGHELSIGGFGIAGWNGFCLSGVNYDVLVYGFFLFQMVFMDTTATIPTGAMAERWRFSAFIIYGFFISMICYPIYGHMVWGGGGLAMLGQTMGLGHGAVDFAGSSVVHAVGGWAGLAGAIVLGPRIGKFVNGKVITIAGHDIPMALVGTFILAFGWFGFNPGSMLGIAGGGNLRVGIVATNTMLASAGGAMAALIWMKLKTGKYDPGMAANGMLAGLVAITAPCAFVQAWSSVVIGILAGILVILSIQFFDRIKVDDPVGAVSVHGVCGTFGFLSLGIFADGAYGAGWNGVGATEYLGKAGLGVTGLLYGDSGQLAAQAIAAVVCFAWAFGSSFLFFKLQSKFMKLRPSAEDEIAGLDIPEMGALAFPGYTLAPED